jgi:hypothetical protein
VVEFASFGRPEPKPDPEPAPAPTGLVVAPTIQVSVVPVLDAAALQRLGEQIRQVIHEAVKAAFGTAADELTADVETTLSAE